MSTTPTAGELADRLAEVGLPALRRRGRRGVLRRKPGHRPGPAGRSERAAGGADRADAEVRRDDRRGARLGRGRRRTAARPRLHRRADRRARGASDRLREQLDGAAAKLTRAARQGGDPARAGVTDELALLAMPHATRHRRGRPARGRAPETPARRCCRSAAAGCAPRARRRRGRAPARRQHRRRRAAAAQGCVRRRALPGDAGRRGRRWPRPARCRSSSSTRWTPASAARRPIEVGRRLAALARDAQVLVVTHLPQVAAFADRHVVVHKSSDGTVTTSGPDRARRRRAGARAVADARRRWRSPTAPWPTRASCWRPPAAPDAGAASREGRDPTRLTPWRGHEDRSPLPPTPPRCPASRAPRASIAVRPA